MNDTGDKTLLELRAISRVYGEGPALVTALDGIDLDVRRGDFLAMMGPSGSGKSTCMNILGCLDTPSGGEYRFQGVPVSRLTRNQRALLRRNFLGFIFQGFNLLARTSALENVELPLIYRGVPAAERRRLSMAALAAVGLEGREKARPNELSGGQQQRVAIARAVVSRPSLLLADEPTGNLDSARSREIMEMLQRFNREQGITVVVITHEPEMAAYAGRTVHFLDGKLVTPAEVTA